MIVQFLGDGCFGDELPSEILLRLADMDLGIECFTGPKGAGGMRNIQVIDGAQNCTFGIFRATREEFARLFPAPRQDIQYSEDLATLPCQEEVEAALAQLWERPIRKQNALGIHGTIFCQLDRYKAYYPEKREDAITPSAVNQAQRRLFGIV